jgi:hypothetical protein
MLRGLVGFGKEDMATHAPFVWIDNFKKKNAMFSFGNLTEGYWDLRLFYITI